jgi:GH15 family glucan-1,4-alpha-glucosidase
MRMDLVLRFGYGLNVPWVSRIDDGGLSAIVGPSRVILRTPAEVRGEAMTTVAEFKITKGEVIPFVLSHQASHLPAVAKIDPEAALKETDGFWFDWLSHCKVTGPYVEAIHHSLITLKALTYAPTGGLVAAPTTSLPEQFGGERNWDYRFCWIRNSTLALAAGADERGLLRGSCGVAGLAPTRGRRRPRRDADHVWHWGRTTADRVGC